MKRRIGPGRIVFFILLGAMAVSAFGGITMLLWNNVLVPVLHVSTVTFWQALGVLILSKILFSSFNGGGRHYHHRNKMMQKWNEMTPEEREKIKQEWRNRWWKGGQNPWHNETVAGE